MLFQHVCSSRVPACPLQGWRADSASLELVNGLGGIVLAKRGQERDASLLMLVCLSWLGALTISTYTLRTDQYGKFGQQRNAAFSTGG